jgi:hypothetical protein
MNRSSHLGALLVEEAAEGEITPEVRSHLAHCTACRALVSRAAEMERMLHAMPRLEPDPGLAPRIRKAIADAAAARPIRRHAYPFGAAAAISALLALALVYQAGIELQVGGALNFFSFYLSQPDVLVSYPGDALAALVEVLPLAQITATMTVLAIAIVLLGLFRASIAVTPARGSNHQA